MHHTHLIRKSMKLLQKSALNAMEIVNSLKEENNDLVDLVDLGDDDDDVVDRNEEETLAENGMESMNNSLLRLYSSSSSSSSNTTSNINTMNLQQQQEKMQPPAIPTQIPAAQAQAQKSNKRKEKASSFSSTTTSTTSSSTTKKPKLQSLSEKWPSPTAKLSDLGGIDEITQELLQLIGMPLLHPEIFAHLGIEPPRGILLQGAPGCGKTFLANAIAGEAGVPFISIAAPTIVSGMSGESEKKIRGIEMRTNEQSKLVKRTISSYCAYYKSAQIHSLQVSKAGIYQLHKNEKE